jgi:hypothetical protein
VAHLGRGSSNLPGRTEKAPQTAGLCASRVSVPPRADSRRSRRSAGHDHGVDAAQVAVAVPEEVRMAKRRHAMSSPTSSQEPGKRTTPHFMPRRSRSARSPRSPRSAGSPAGAHTSAGPATRRPRPARPHVHVLPSLEAQRRKRAPHGLALRVQYALLGANQDAISRTFPLERCSRAGASLTVATVPREADCFASPWPAGWPQRSQVPR